MLAKFLGSIVCTVFMTIVYVVVGIAVFTPTGSGSDMYALVVGLSAMVGIVGIGAGILTGLVISCVTDGRKPILVGAITSLAAWVFLFACFWIGSRDGGFEPLRVLTVLSIWTAAGAFGGLGYKLIPQNK
jgi:hypothetical protein